MPRIERTLSLSEWQLSFLLNAFVKDAKRARKNAETNGSQMAEQAMMHVDLNDIGKQLSGEKDWVF